MPAESHDIVVVGGGPIGCAFACALKDTGLDVMLLEAKHGRGRFEDTRTLALTWGSCLILQRLGIRDALDSATPIRSIHVSQRGRFGRTELRAEELKLPALGYVLRYADLHRALLDRALQSGAQIREGIMASDVFADGNGVRVEISDVTTPMRARLAVVADGGIELSAKAGARFRSVDYRQSAVVASVSTGKAHDHRAYERFTSEGPVALLPHGDTYALVWSCAPEQVPGLTALDDDAFLARLQLHFGDRAGRFDAVRNRASFPLSLRFASNPVLPRMVMLGNAAQALHPIAGQGFNLGLRDSWELADTIIHRRREDPGEDAVLAAYRRARTSDRFAGIALTDALTRIFSNDIGALAFARGVAMASLDILPPAKRFLMRRMIFGSRL